MSLYDWKKIEYLFNKATGLNKEDRIPFLRSECAGDEELFNELASLLESDEEIHPILEKKASDLINVEQEFNFIGQQVGSYKIVKEIASGGMGTVFLAERSDGFFQQKVALKIVKPGLSTIPIIRRFQQERQVLANLQHPNIAKLFDGGVTEDKRPFFTMEFVDGVPIDEYCDNKKLTIKERLHLFIKVCETVQYAHNNLVIHRDLKPSNILIRKDGTIKLLDFGISKVLSAEAENRDMPTITQAEINLLTPEYSSPEQFKKSNITVSADVYSLGLILYKLLSGSTAHQFTSRTFSEFEKVVCEKNISKPSTILNNKITNKGERNVFESRQTQPSKLKRVLNGDLDNICMMALRKDPERRYVSVEMLAYDVERYLNNLPILARKESLLYTTKKFVTRHKKVVAAATILFFVVNGLILYYTIQLRHERDIAQREARKSEQVASFLEDLFLVSDPNESKGETITARELLDRGAERLRRGLEEEPEIKSQLLNTIGKVYTNLGLYSSAEEIFKNLKENEKLASLSRETYIEILVNLGKIYRFSGKYNLAGELLIYAKREGGNQLASNHPILGDIYNNLGSYHYETAGFDSSYIYYKKAEEIFRSNFEHQNIYVADVIYNLGVLEFDKGNLIKSDSLYRISLDIYQNLYGELNSKTATVQNELASVLRHSGQFEEAEVLYKKALETRIKIFGDNHPDVAHTLNHISRLYYNQEQYQEAEPYVRKSLEVRQGLYESNHPEVSASKSSLAGVLMGLKRYKEAEELYRSAYKASKEKFGEKHHYTPALLGNVALALMEQKKYDEAERKLLLALDMLEKLDSYRPSYRSGRIVSLAELYNRTKRYEEAEELLRTELNLLKSKNDGTWLVGFAESELGYSLFKQSKDIEAEGLLVNGFNNLKKHKGEKSSITIKALKKIIDFYKSKGRKDKVQEYSAYI